MRSQLQNYGVTRDIDLEGGIDVGLNGAVEAGEGVVAGDVVEIFLLFDVVLVVLLADRVDSG